jgi:hypothetical protein
MNSGRFGIGLPVFPIWLPDGQTTKTNNNLSHDYGVLGCNAV